MRFVKLAPVAFSLIPAQPFVCNHGIPLFILLMTQTDKKPLFYITFNKCTKS